MRRMKAAVNIVALCILPFTFSACAYKAPAANQHASRAVHPGPASAPTPNYASRLPSHIDTHGERIVVVDPRVHAWGAYGSDGNLIRAGLATAGASYCPDIKRACHTKTGSFRVQSLGAASCKSSIYPLPKGGAPMPYCMFFNKNQGLHGSYNVVDGNASHGCVRLKVADAEWLRFNFVKIGTKVVVKPY